jgi:sporulation protein YlmC with PRC-barrel domain
VVPKHPSVLTAEALRGRVRAERATTNRAVRRAIVSVAGLLGSPVRNWAGQEVGRLMDVVVRMDGEERYPPVTGLVVRGGRRRAFVETSDIAGITHNGARCGPPAAA